jgi:hypothetical protein
MQLAVEVRTHVSRRIQLGHNPQLVQRIQTVWENYLPQYHCMFIAVAFVIVFLDLLTSNLKYRFENVLFSLRIVLKNNYSAGVETAMSRLVPQWNILAAKEKQLPDTTEFIFTFFVVFVFCFLACLWFSEAEFTSR